MRHTIITETAHRIRRSDMLMVDEETKEISEAGTPHSISHVDNGNKWSHINLDESVGRKRVFKVGMYEEVPVLRGVPEMSDVYQRITETVAMEALDAQRDLELAREELAKVAADTGDFKPKRSYYSRRGTLEFQRKGIDAMTRQAAHVAEEEVAAEFWASVQHLYLNEDRDGNRREIHEAVSVAIENVKRNLIEGRHYDTENERREARFIIRRYEHLGDPTQQASRMGVPEEWRTE